MSRPVRGPQVEKKGTMKSTPATRTAKKPASKALAKKGTAPVTSSEPAPAETISSNGVIPKPVPSKRRQDLDEPISKPAKRLKATTLNSAPTEKLDIYVCGEGEAGELGLGPKPIEGMKPTHVKRPRRNRLLNASTVGVIQIAAGGMHCVSLTHDQKVVTWGVNDNGALGRDTTWEAPTRDIDQESNSDSDDEADLSPKESTPTAIPAENFGKVIPTFVQVVALDSASFALTSEGLVYGWGTFRANDGILGFSTKNAIESEKTKNAEKKLQRKPMLVPSLTKIVSIAAGNNHILALDNKGKVFAWGTGEQNQLGRRIVERTRVGSLTPCRVALSKIKQIACGAYHCFAIDEAGLVYAWGSNNFGQTGLLDGAGNGDAAVLKPGIVEALRPYKIREIQGGEHHSLACTNDGKLLVWGRCDDGQAGMKLDELPQDKLVFDEWGRPRILQPTVIPAIHAVSVAAGIDDSFVITSEGDAYSWGFSANYRTGQGTEDTVTVATLLDRGDVKGKKLAFAGCGGQFSVLAGYADI